jgi:F-type H+-transporting ATPase subunit epsilon
MKKYMYLEIITPDKKLFSGEVKSVKLPGSVGAFGVLKNHAPLISSLKKGTIKVVDEQKQNHYFEIKSGVVEVLKNKITVLAE